jgi:hypothetical protein
MLEINSAGSRAGVVKIDEQSDGKDGSGRDAESETALERD